MKFSQSMDIAADTRLLFDLTQDYKHRLAWDPFLKEARLLDWAASPDIGIRAWCVARNGIGMETQYVSFEPPRVCAVEMTRGPWLIRSFAGSWKFDLLGPVRSRVSFTYNLIGRPSFMTWFIGAIFANETRRRLAALKVTAESGSKTPKVPGVGSS